MTNFDLTRIADALDRISAIMEKDDPEGPPIVIERADSPPAKPRATRSLAKPEPMPESATGETMNNQLREELDQYGFRKSHLPTDGLKPCPLCGGRPLLNCYEHGASWSGMWEIECPKCDLIIYEAQPNLPV